MSQYIHYPNESGGGSSITVTDTNSVGLTLAGTVLSADVSISSNAADAGNLVVPIDIESTGVVGLRAQVSNAGIRALFSGVSPILYNSSTGAVSIQVAMTAQNGYLSSTDWNTFNGKQVAGNYITALTGDATASGPGSVALTLATVNGNVGSFGTATQVGSFTVNAKGLITAAANTSIQIAESQVTNLVSDLAGKQPVGNYITALTGDATATGPGSVALTLATVNSNVGSFGTAANVGAFTVNAKGLITAAASTAIQIAESQVTNLVTDLAGKQSTSTLTTKGDLYVRDSTVVTREPVGADGFVLTADSAQTTGIKWAAPASVTEVIGKANTSAGQGITGPGMTVINYDNVLKDTASAITTGAGWTYTVPSNGDYQIAASLLSENISPGVGVIFTLEIWLNGSFTEFIDREVFMTASAVNLMCKGCTILTGLTAGDTIQFQCSYGGASSTILSTNPGGNFVSIYKIPGS